MAKFLRNWLRRWLGIDGHDDLWKEHRILQKQIDNVQIAIDGLLPLLESFKMCSAEIEKLRERIDQRAAEPTQTVRRAASHAEFRSAAEASVRAKK